MTVDQLTNTPAKLIIAGVDGSGEPASRTLTLARSLPLPSATALIRDLTDLGRRDRSPYHFAKPQLDALARMAKESTDPDERVMLMADRQTILDRIADGVVSGRADDLAQDKYLEIGRQSVEGLRREIQERASVAGEKIAPADLAAIVTAGNAGKVYADLIAALGDGADPSTPAT